MKGSHERCRQLILKETHSGIEHQGAEDGDASGRGPVERITGRFGRDGKLEDFASSRDEEYCTGQLLWQGCSCRLLKRLWAWRGRSPDFGVNESHGVLSERQDFAIGWFLCRQGLVPSQDLRDLKANSERKED